MNELSAQVASESQARAYDGLARVYSCVLSGFALLVSAPILILLCVLVRLDSPGPAIFVQQRLGRNLTPFKIYKLRTMAHGHMTGRTQTEEAVIVSNSDSRITRLGRFLRASSLDELPQLWNILKGDMNVVGPRPLLPDQLPAVPSSYMRRFGVRPGLTGLSQVRGRRGLDWPKQLSSDVEYVECRGLLQDADIIVRTVIQVIARRGIYSADARNWREFIGKNFS